MRLVWMVVGPSLVYFATCLAACWLAHRLILQLRRSVIVFLVLAPLILTGRALLSGGVYAPIDIPYQAPPLAAHATEMGIAQPRNPILGDVVTQEIPWRKAVREAVKNGRLPLWNRFVLAGEPLAAVQQPAVLHPLTWASLLLPLAQGWTLDMTLRFFLALLFAYLFFRDLGCREISALLGAAAWAFCDYIVFWVGYPLAPAVAPLPLLLLGLRRLVNRRDAGAVALTVAALLLILVSGHPETLLHCVAGGGVYFLFELASARTGGRLRPVLLSVLAGALALGLAAALLLPLAEALPHTFEQLIRRTHYAHVVKSLPAAESARQALLNVMPYFFGVPGKGETVAGRWDVASYAGSLLWPLAAIGLAGKAKTRWALFAVGVLGVAVAARAPGITDLISKLPLFDIALNNRLAFLGAFAIAALAALGLDQLLTGGSSRLWAVASLGAAAGLGLLAVQSWPQLASLDMPQNYFRSRLLLQLVPLLLLAGLLLASRRLRPAVFGSCVLALLLVERGLEERDVYPTYPNRAFYPRLACLDPIPRTLPYRMTAVGYSFIPNIAALYELEDVRGYEAMTFWPLFETYPLWSVYQPVWFNRVDDPTKPFLSFLNVRWVYAPSSFRPPSGWPVLYKGPEGMLLENPAVLPRAFVPREIAYEPEPERRVPLLSTISNFAARGVVGEPAPRDQTAGAWQGNGQASVEIVSYLPKRLTLDIVAAESSLVATSVTAWPGWKLTIDGTKVPLVSYNHAFLGFRVPPGRHTAVLRYWPVSYTAGLAITAASLLACGWLLRRASAKGGERIKK